MAVKIMFISLSLAVTLTSVLAVNDALATACPQHVTAIPRSYTTTHNSICYLFVNKELYWKKAREKCWDLGGEMLYIDNQATMDFIKGKLNSPELSWDRKGVWLGASKVSGGRWIWTNGRVMDYMNWAPGQPTNLLGVFSVEDCSQMRQDDGWKWHDIPCGKLNFHYNYVCQFPVETTSQPAMTSTTVAQTSPPLPPPPPPSRASYYMTRNELKEEHYRRLEEEFHKKLSGHGMAVTPSTLHLDSHHPSALNRPGDPAGRVSSSAAYQTEDNGNFVILAIIIAVSTGLLLVMAIIFLVLYLHQRRKRQKAAESAVHFSNNTYNRSPAAPPIPDSRAPAVPTSQVPFASNEELYLDPLQDEKHGGHVLNINFSPKGCSCNHKQLAANKSISSSLGSDSELGACGGSDPEQELKVPLMASNKTNCELVGSSSAAHSSIHSCPPLNGDEYVDMTSIAQESKKDKHMQEEDEKHTYSNVEHRDSGIENLYEVLP